MHEPNTTPMRTRVLLGMAALAAATAGWSAEQTAVEELESRIAKHGSVTFRSWNGQHLGMDSDTDIIFMPNRIVHMTEYGYVSGDYKGIYRVDRNGEVNAKFTGYNHEWPVMLLRKDSVSLLLDARSGSGFVMGNGGGAYIPAGKGGYWPFRPVSTMADDVVFLVAGQPMTRAGHTLSILRKQDGRWLLARDANMLSEAG